MGDKLISLMYQHPLHRGGHFLFFPESLHRPLKQNFQPYIRKWKGISSLHSVLLKLSVRQRERIRHAGLPPAQGCPSVPVVSRGLKLSCTFRPCALEESQVYLKEGLIPTKILWSLNPVQEGLDPPREGISISKVAICAIWVLCGHVYVSCFWVLFSFQSAYPRARVFQSPFLHLTSLMRQTLFPELRGLWFMHALRGGTGVKSD